MQFTNHDRKSISRGGRDRGHAVPTCAQHVPPARAAEREGRVVGAERREEEQRLAPMMCDRVWRQLTLSTKTNSKTRMTTRRRSSRSSSVQEPRGEADLCLGDLARSAARRGTRPARRCEWPCSCGATGCSRRGSSSATVLRLFRIVRRGAPRGAAGRAAPSRTSRALGPEHRCGGGRLAEPAVERLLQTAQRVVRWTSSVERWPVPLVRREGSP